MSSTPKSRESSSESSREGSTCGMRRPIRDTEEALDLEVLLLHLGGDRKVMPRKGMTYYLTQISSSLAQKPLAHEGLSLPSSSSPQSSCFIFESKSLPMELLLLARLYRAQPERRPVSLDRLRENSGRTRSTSPLDRKESPELSVDATRPPGSCSSTPAHHLLGQSIHINAFRTDHLIGHVLALSPRW